MLKEKEFLGIEEINLHDANLISKKVFKFFPFDELSNNSYSIPLYTPVERRYTQRQLNILHNIYTENKLANSNLKQNEFQKFSGVLISWEGIIEHVDFYKITPNEDKKPKLIL